MLKLKNLNQFYGQSHTLWDISLEVQKGLTWYAKEACLESKWGLLDFGQDVSEITSRRIWRCVGTRLLLHRDAANATSGRNFGNIVGDYTEKTASKTIGIEPKKRLFAQCFLSFASKTPIKTTKNARKSLFLWQYMADYGNSKSYCHTNIFL